MVRLIESTPIYHSLEEIAVHAEREFLMKVDNNILLIAGDPHGIFNHWFRPHLIHLLNIIILIIIILNYILFSYYIIL